MERLTLASRGDAPYFRYYEEQERLKLFSAEDYPTFWEEYSQAAIKNIDNRLGEYFGPQTPLLMSIKIRIREEELNNNSQSEETGTSQRRRRLSVRSNRSSISNRGANEMIFNPAITKILAKLLIATVREVLNVTPDQLKCCVLMSKPYPIHDMQIVDLRLQMPMITVQLTDLDTVIRLRFAKKLRDEKFFDNFDESLVDENIIEEVGKVLPLYGSTRMVNTYPVKLVEIFDTSDQNQYSKRDKLFPVGQHNHFNLYNGMTEFKEKNEKIKDFFLPLIFSVEYHPNKLSSVKKELATGVLNLDRSLKNKTEEVRDAYDLLLLINPESYANEELMLTVGKAIYNVFSDMDAREVGLRNWIRCCKQNPKFEKMETTEFEAIYRTFSSRNPYTERTLYEYAMKDNEDETGKWERGRIDRAMYTALKEEKSPVALAQVFFYYYWTKFMYIEANENDSWYSYSNAVIKRISMTEIYNHITTDFRSKLKEYSEELVRKQANPAKKNGDLNVMKKTIDIICNDLGSGRSYKALADIAKLKFYSASKHAVLNADYNLTATSNGWVLVSTKTGMDWRKGKIEDCITKCTIAPFIPELTATSPSVVKYWEMMRKYYRTKEEREFVTLLYSACLISHNNFKKIIFEEAPTNAGKSIKKHVSERVFGVNETGYSFTFNSTTATGARSHSGPTPEMAHTADDKLVYYQELEDNDKVNEGLLREQSGGDSLFARFNFKNGGNMVFTAMIWFIINRAPRLNPYADNKSRILLLNQQGQFVEPDQAPATEEEQYAKMIFPMKELSEDELMSISIGMLWSMVQIHKELKKSPKLKIPEVIKRNTERYWNRTDFYSIFLKENTVKDEKYSIKTKHLYSVFIDWMMKNYRDIKINKSKFLENLRDLAGAPVGEGKEEAFQGYRLSSEIYDQFKEECAKPADPKITVSVPKAYKEFVRWFRDYCGNGDGRVPSRELFQEYMHYLLGEAKPRIGYSGWLIDGFPE